MHKTRLDFHNFLLGYCENVYYRPPEGLKLKFPAIVYDLSSIDNIHSENKVYLQKKPYSVTVISKNPEEPIVEDISKITLCRFDRNFVTDNLNHTTFKIYY